MYFDLFGALGIFSRDGIIADRFNHDVGSRAPFFPSRLMVTSVYPTRESLSLVNPSSKTRSRSPS